MATRVPAAPTEDPGGLTEDWTASSEGSEGLAAVEREGEFEESWSVSSEGSDGLAVLEEEAAPGPEPSVVPPAMVVILE